MATLKVRNEHSDTVTIEPDSGSGSVDIASGADGDLEARHLVSTSFRRLLREGKVRFIETVSPTVAQYQTARAVFPHLMRAVGSGFVELGELVEAATENLAAKREDYNRRWQAVEAALLRAEAAAGGADHLYRGCDHFVNLSPEQAAVTQIEADIAALEAEDLAVTGRTLEEWYADRDARQEELEAAQADVEAARAAYVTPLENLKQALNEASTAFQAVDPTQDIGSEIPDWP